MRRWLNTTDRLAPKETAEEPSVPLHRGALDLQRGVVQRCAHCKASAQSAAAEGPSGYATSPTERSAVDAVVLSNRGEPLDDMTRAYFEPRLGHDFGAVRVHAGEDADASARAIDADAYTLGDHVVFREGYYAPHADEGRSLLAHELTHVARQVAACGAPGIVQRQKAGTAPKPHPKADPLEKAHEEALAAVGDVESNWRFVRGGGAKAFDILQPWLGFGDAVVTMIRLHTESYFLAERANDVELAAAYRLAIEGEKTTYDYIAWHVVVYANLLALKPQMEGLIDSFDHDNRKFTGRGNAERLVREFKVAGDGVAAESASKLKLIRVDVPLVVREGTARKVTITVTSPLIDASAKALFLEQTAEMIGLQGNIQKANAVVNQFIDTARAEGFAQAVDALQQYYNLKGVLEGPSPKLEKEVGPAPSEEAQPELFPVPIVAPMPDDDKKRKRPYPICWPTVLGPPHSVFFVRVKSAERDEEEAKQGRMALEWRRFRDPDFDPSKYHVHHVDPLFLGGPDDLKRNATTLEKGMHLRGHASLRKQPQMANPPAPLPPLPTDLYKHPGGIPYELVGFKTDSDDTC
jgi:hypothetical protein